MKSINDFIPSSTRPTTTKLNALILPYRWRWRHQIYFHFKKPCNKQNWQDGAPGWTNLTLLVTMKSCRSRCIFSFFISLTETILGRMKGKHNLILLCGNIDINTTLLSGQHLWVCLQFCKSCNKWTWQDGWPTCTTLTYMWYNITTTRSLNKY